MGDYGRLIGHRVISIEEGKMCGNVIDFLVDFEKFTVFAVIVKGGWNQDAEIVPFDDIESVGSDAVMILNSKAIQPVKSNTKAKKAVQEHINVSKLEVITKSGHVVGKISTFEFDTSTGKIMQFEIAGSVLKSIFEGRNIIPVSQIISIGKDAMIIQDKKGAAVKSSAQTKTSEKKSEKSSASKKSTVKKKSAKKSSSAKKTGSRKKSSTKSKKSGTKKKTGGRNKKSSSKKKSGSPKKSGSSSKKSSGKKKSGSGKN